MSLDECMHAKDLFTFLTNKEGHGKRGTLAAVARGTKVADVERVLMQIPEEQRLAVEEITMDFSDSMYQIAKRCFPNATIVVDCFHIVQRVCDALNEMRMRHKRKAVVEQKKEEAEYKAKMAKRRKARAYYHKKHPRKKNGEKRGRPRLRANEKFKPTVLSNGDTKVDLLTRARYILPKSGEDWSERQKERAALLFDMCPDIKEAYSLVCKLRAILRDRKITRSQARERLHGWYHEVAKSSIREIKSARDCIKAKEEEVLNFFINRSTNAAAESFNSKAKGFRSELRGVRDLPFFFYRCAMIFG
ncbi:transposase [Staphylococcus aureus]|uniref:transposase n=1 Tax=Staphylococcus aureus TaxID=1280 RepID=UPI001EFDF07B|nr:transposase [Staphylococcus aureus]